MADVLDGVAAAAASSSASSRWNVSSASAGKSEEGRDIWLLVLSPRHISASSPIASRLLLVGNMHGDEPVGRRVVVDFARWLLLNGTQQTIAHNLSTVVYIIPSLNPDGFARCTRGNANGLDLNRNFPDRWGKSTGPVQAESRVAMELLRRHGPFLVADVSCRPCAPTLSMLQYLLPRKDCRMAMASTYISGSSSISFTPAFRE